MTNLETPLRWPCGKSKAIEKIKPFMDLEQYDEIREPFLGGGSVFLWLRQKYPDKFFWINDLYRPLYCFWKVMQENPKRLQVEIRNVKMKNRDIRQMKETFHELKTRLPEMGKLEAATSFYVINRCSFSGSTESGGFSPTAVKERFTDQHIGKLHRYQSLLKDVEITNLDYTEMLNYQQNDRVFLFMDPPCDIVGSNGALYGKKGALHKGFSHEGFAEAVLNCEHDFGITYNDNESIRNAFSSCKIDEWSLDYSMKAGGNKKGSELFISRRNMGT